MLVLPQLLVAGARVESTVLGAAVVFRPVSTGVRVCAASARSRFSTMTDAKTDEFGSVAKTYAKFRPTYPTELLQHLLRYEQSNSNEAVKGLVVDVGTGSGQMAFPIAADGYRVVGIDKSQKQLDQALAKLEQQPDIKSRVIFKERSCYEIPAGDGEACMVLAAQAAHWFDMDRYAKEVDRVLQPGGVMALTGYGICYLEHEAGARAFTDYYDGMRSHWPGTCDRNRLDTGHMDFQLPRGFGEFERKWFASRRTLTFGHFMGYVRTWSALAAYRKTNSLHSNDKDPSHELEVALRRAMEIASDDDPVTVTFPFFLLMCRKGTSQLQQGSVRKPVDVREVTAEDYEDVWHIYESVLRAKDTYPQLPLPTRQDFQNDWLTTARHQHTYVATIDGQVVGTYTLDDNKPGQGAHVAHGSYMVSPYFWRRGVGRAMGKHSISEAARLGYKAMQFNLVVETNVGSLALWRGLGFHIVGVLPQAFLHPTHGHVDAYVMYRFVDGTSSELLHANPPLSVCCGVDDKGDDGQPLGRESTAWQVPLLAGVIGLAGGWFLAKKLA